MIKQKLNYFQNKIYKIIQTFALKKKVYRKRRRVFCKFDLYMKKEAVALDLGSGPTPSNPFRVDKIYGADLRSNDANNVHFVDFSSGKLPFEDNYFDFVTAFDLLEHIQRVSVDNKVTRFPFVNLMSEIYRVLKKDGVFFCIQPCYPFKETFQDPTHVNFMTEDTIDKYFCSDVWAQMYGFNGRFKMLDDGWLSWKYFCFIQKTEG